MKVLIINKSMHNGGAAVAATRLFNALKQNDTSVKMLVEDPVVETDDIKCIANSGAKKRSANRRFVFERLHFLPHEKNKTIRFKFSPAKSGVDISKHPLVKEADIIHLHWINHGFLSLRGIKKLFKLNKPIVWTMHDMWLFTGGCHYSGECNHYKEKCGNCQFLRFSGKNDFSKRIYKKKNKIFEKVNINAVGCSNWIMEMAKSGTLLHKHNVLSVPNPIDTELFKPLDIKQCREEFGLPQDKKLLLFGAANISDTRKGIKYLIHALEFLDVRYPELSKKLELVIFGKCKKQELKKLSYKCHKIKFISEPAKLVKLYNCADAFVLPSLEDNLPNTIMESLACGVPVVAFNTGGVPEMIEQNETGYIASQKNSDELAIGIYTVIFKGFPSIMKSNARDYAINNYSNNVVAKKYQELYQSVLG